MLRALMDTVGKKQEQMTCKQRYGNHKNDEMTRDQKHVKQNAGCL